MLWNKSLFTDYYRDMIQKKVIVWIFAIFVLFSIQAEETDQTQETEIFAPFVTQLEGEIRNNLIRISWKDARDIQGPVYVYRSEVPFDTLGILPVPVEVPYGTGSFLDEAENPGMVYYFVVASDEYGRKYLLPILNTNTLSIAVAPENVPGFSERPAPNDRETPIQPQMPVPSIEKISVRIDDDKVIITFSGADKTKNLLLYRSINPIKRQEDLLSALIIRQKVSSPVIDYPLPGITYHYALIYEEDLNSGIFNIRTGYNATEGIQIYSAARKNSREMPLPGLNLSAPPEDGFSNFVTENFGLHSEADLFPERQNEKTSKKETEVFPEDLIKGGTGEDALLRSIVQGYFSLKEWNIAAEEFRRFLDLPRDGHNRARARFYLGQVYYFQGKPREALFEFLSAQELYPDDSNSWIQAVLGDFAR